MQNVRAQMQHIQVVITNSRPIRVFLQERTYTLCPRLATILLYFTLDVPRCSRLALYYFILNVTPEKFDGKMAAACTETSQCNQPKCMAMISKCGTFEQHNEKCGRHSLFARLEYSIETI